MPRRATLPMALVLVLMLTSALPPSFSVGAGPRGEQSESIPTELTSAGAGSPTARAGSFASHEDNLLAEPPFTTAPAGVRLLSSTSAGVTFEVAVPWQELSVAAVSAGGKDYQRVSIPGWTTTSQPGAPALPFLAQAIGVPFGVGFNVQVEPGPVHTLALPAPALPVVTQRVQWDPQAAIDRIPALPSPSLAVEEDPAVYAGESAYPGSLAEVVSDGVVRQQRVAGIAAYPVQYHAATGELTVYESLSVQVTFTGTPLANGGLPPAESPAYEQVFQQSLLNYEPARAWRQTGVLPAPLLAGGTEEGSLPWTPPVPGWRVKVRVEGFYKLTYAELQTAGLPVASLDPRTFQLYNLGSEIAIEVTGEADGQFDPADYLLFYGQAVASKYTADNVYWLTYGQAPGLRVQSRDGTPGSGQTPAYYRARRRVEPNVFYLTGLPGDDDLERWVWDYLYPPSRPSWSTAFSLAAPYTGTYTATLTVALLGYLQYPISPDHHAQVYLNGTLIADLWWDGITWQVPEIDVAQDLLVAGDSTLTVECPNDTGAGVDLVEVDWAQLDFANTFLAEGDELFFGYDAPGTSKFQADGFSNDRPAVYDVTAPGAVARIEGIDVIPSGPGYAAVFQDDLTAPARYWALAGNAYRTVRAIEADTSSYLQSPANGADYLVITHQSFWDQAVALSDHRASQGLRSMPVDVQDVYDEFGYGMVGVAAIHDFLAYAYAHWQAPAPSYVLLIGDGHYDPKDYYGYGRESYVPPYLAAADPWMVETAADNRYVTLVGGDTFPDMMLGRLSVNSSDEASALVNKIVAYETSPEPGDWNQQVLAVADNADSAGDFAQMSDALLTGTLPNPYQAQKVYYGVTHMTPSQARAAIQDGINAGRLIVNYIGHADMTRWADEGLLTTADVPLLQNGGKLPVMLPMTCYDGYYPYPFPSEFGLDAMGEVVTRADGRGAVASWSPTGMGVSTGHESLDQGFFQAVFLDGMRRLGQATTAGKLKLWATGANLDLLDTYLLFGDPALHIAALDADLQVGKTVEPTGPVLPGAVLTYTLNFTNTGPAMVHHVVLTDSIPTELANPKVVYASQKVIGPIPGVTFAWEIRDLLPGEGGEVRVRAVVPLDAPPGAILNTAEIAAAEPDTQAENNVASVITEVAAAMRVGTIKIRARLGGGGKYAIVGKTRILDLGKLPVAGATVHAHWTFPDGTVLDQQAITDALGRDGFRLKSGQLGTYQMCVTGVTKPGWVYDPDHNMETCDTVTVP